MSPSEPSRVFISYAHHDGAVLAQRLQTDLTKEGFDAWLDTQRIAGGGLWRTEIEREIDTRPVTLALLSPSSYASEICRAEQLRALDKGNRVIPVLTVRGADRPLYVYARQYRDFTNEANYAGQFGELLADIRGDATATLPETYQKCRSDTDLKRLPLALVPENHDGSQPPVLNCLPFSTGQGKYRQFQSFDEPYLERLRGGRRTHSRAFWCVLQRADPSEIAL